MKTFRWNFGSMPEVKIVFAYDSQQDRAAILFRSIHSPDFFDIVEASELELAVDGKHEDVRAELRRLALAVTGDAE